MKLKVEARAGRAADAARNSGRFRETPIVPKQQPERETLPLIDRPI